MSALKSSLIRQIQQGGPIDVGRFMQECLAHPQHGYYMTRDPFGAAGDFTTSPEISQMFGEMVGLCLADYWMRMGSPADFVLLECGPGRGTLMADILRSTRAVAGFHAALHLHLLEMSPVLRDMQAAAVAAFELPHGVVFCDGLEDVCADYPVLVLGNEFLDALPVRQFEKHGGSWKERVVGVSADACDLVYGVAQPALDPSVIIPKAVQDLEDGNIYEFSPARLDFTRRVCALLKAQGGAALFIDYGEAGSREGNSLHAIADHEPIPVFVRPGACDISVNVDFGALAVEVEAEGLDLFGVVEQGAFLRELGIDARAEGLRENASVKQGEEIEKSLHRLINSDQMGVLFKVIGFGYGSDIRFAGFSS